MDILTFLRLCLIFLGVCRARAVRACRTRNFQSTRTYIVGLLLALLSTTTEAEHQVEGRLLLDVVVAERAAVLELLAGEDQALLVGGNAGVRR